MTSSPVRLAVPLATTLVLAACATIASAQQPKSPLDRWPIHSTDRPQPPVVAPPHGQSLSPPSDAVVLFDGHSLAAWESDSGRPARWRLGPGYVEVVPGAGDIRTRRAFGDCQLHIEWAAPTPAAGEGQERGNSGVFLMGRYEVQVLDSWHNVTYPDGQAAAVFGQYPPLANASRPPGEWQSYDIVFRAPRFAESGALLRPARLTVFHDGVLVQDAVTLTGPTAFQRRPPYAAHPARLPLVLQDHHQKVRFRNIWIRDIPEEAP